MVILTYIARLRPEWQEWNTGGFASSRHVDRQTDRWGRGEKEWGMCIEQSGSAKNTESILAPAHLANLPVAAGERGRKW